MKRGLATYLQMDMKAVEFNELQVMQVPEVNIRSVLIWIYYRIEQILIQKKC